MGWNEPAKNSNEQDPWGGRKKPPGPPDLDEVLNRLHKKLNELFNKGSDKKSGGAATPSFGGNGSVVGLISIAIVIVVVWALSGFFIVDPAERAVVLRFGKYVETLNAGLHWIPRFIESKYVVDVQKISSYTYEAQMLTKDANIVSVSISVPYRIDNLENYLFKVANPIESLHQATASALRQVIGRTTLDEVLTSGREKVRQEVKQQLTNILARYNTGIIITDVALQSAKAPDEVKDAFDDAIKAQEDEQRFVNQAQAYAMQVGPIAKGTAQRILQEAKAYQQQVVLGAKADIARYLAILPLYKSAEQVTRDRLYIDAIEQVLNNTSKIIVDAGNGSNVMYLPLDKMVQSSAARENAAVSATKSEMTAVAKPVTEKAANPNPRSETTDLGIAARPEGY